MKGNFKTATQRDRLELLIIHLNTTLWGLAKTVGVSKNTLYQVSSREGALSENTAAKICYFLKKKKGVNVNKQWLLTGEGEMIIEELPPKPNEAKTVEKPAEQDIYWREKYYNLLEKYAKLQERRIEFIEKHRWFDNRTISFHKKGYVFFF